MKKTFLKIRMPQSSNSIKAKTDTNEPHSGSCFMLNAVRGHSRFARKAVEELQEAKEQLKQKDRQIDILTRNLPSEYGYEKVARKDKEE